MTTHKKIEAPRALYDLAKTKPGFLHLTRSGKPVAYVLFAADYDDEDIGYMTDPDFWKMIQERRQSNEGVPMDQVIKELEVRERNESASGASRKKRKQRK